MRLINMHKQKTRPIGRIANTKSNLTLSVRKGVVNKARPSFYVTIVKHGIENYLERAQPDFSEARTAREFLSPQPPFLPAPSERFAGAKRRRLGVLQEMISSRTVKIHQNLTFCNNTNFFRGRAKCVPSISPPPDKSSPLGARRRASRLAKTRFVSRAILILSRICFAQ